MTIGALRVPWWMLYATLGALAFCARLLLMLRGGGLVGVGQYDDGVYYAAAASLVHGRLPYVDFLFIQPPGIVLAASPFAWLGSITTDTTGFVAGRIAFMAVGAVSTMLIAAILRPFGFMTAALGGLFFAVSFTAIYGERSILLEPLGTVGILIALYVMSRPDLRSRTGWLITAGIAAGVATGFKIWYLVPAVIIIGFAGRGWWKLLLGAVAGACAIYLPFFLPSPAKAFQQIVLDQLGRGSGGVAIGTRLHVIFGDFPLPRVLSSLGFDLTALTTVMVVVAVVGAVVALTVPGARLYVLLLAVDVLVLLTAPSFYLHYAALTTPMLALVFGVALGHLIGRIRWVPLQAVTVFVVATLLVVANSAHVLHGAGTAVPTATLTARAAKIQGCVMADDPTLLVAANALTRDLVQGCELWPDVTGYTYGPDRKLLASGEAVPRPDNEQWQRSVMQYLTSGSAVILSRSSTGLDADSRRLLMQGEVLYRRPGLVFVRTPARQS